MRIATLFITLLLVLFAPPELRAQRSSASHKSVVVRQLALGQGCTAACQTKEAYITIPHALGDMLKGGVGARQVHGTPIDGVPTFPRKTTWTGPDENDLAREYDQFVQANLAAYASAMTAWQTQYGMATATHDLIQRVTHRGREKRIIVNVITFDNGVHYHNGARVMPDDAAAAAQILYVRAIPSAVTAGLPASWNWAGGGRLYYELRGPAFAPGAGFTTVSVGATYDEPFDYSGTAYDPDSRLKCLVNKSLGGCGQPQPDVKGLIGSTDATYAVLDYYRRVKPSGVPYGGGFAAQLAARVTNRVVTFACPTDNNGTYAQVFRYTMRAENQIDRYLVFPDGRHYFLQTFRDVVSPAEVAVPGTSAITRNGEYPNLSSRFLHHKTNAYTSATAYAPNPVSLGSVALNQPASCCVAQPNYSELRWCSELNGSWTGFYTRYYTFSTATCAYSTYNDTSGCATSPPPPVDVCDNIPGTQTSPPPGTFQSGSSCLCTGGRSWDTGSSSCQCPSGFTWNGSSCIPPPQDQCVYMNGVLDPPIQSTVPPGLVQMPGFNCVTATVPLDISGNVTGGGEVTVSGPGFSCTLNIFQSSCPTARVSSNSSIGITFSPNLTWGGPGSVFYGIYAFSSNGSCDFSNNAVWGPVSCTYWSGSGGSINFYAPRCTTATGWTTC